MEKIVFIKQCKLIHFYIYMKYMYYICININKNIKNNKYTLINKNKLIEEHIYVKKYTMIVKKIPMIMEFYRIQIYRYFDKKIFFI